MVVVVGVVVVVGRLTGVVVCFLRGGVVVVEAGLFAGLVEGRLVLPPPITPPPVTPPSCCARATLLVIINRTPDRQIERGDGKYMTILLRFRPEMNGDNRVGHYS